MDDAFAWLCLSGVTESFLITSTIKANPLFLKENQKPAQLLLSSSQR
jgi:hypothetical protein